MSNLYSVISVESKKYELKVLDACKIDDTQKKKTMLDVVKAIEQYEWLNCAPSTEKIKDDFYQNALDYGYSDNEIIAFLFKIYGSSRTEEIKSYASKSKMKPLIKNIFNDILLSVALSLCFYLIACAFYLTIRWIINGFNHEILPCNQYKT